MRTFKLLWLFILLNISCEFDVLAQGVVSRPPNQLTANKPKKSSENSKKTHPKPLNELDPVIQNLINNMIHVEGGSFLMGSDDPDALSVERPVHKVKVGSFSIGKYEVTQKEWNKVMGYNPSHFDGDDLPVENVSWDDCQKFIQKLRTLTGRNFRLPTEAEWEYAARGGNRSNGYKYSGNDDIDKVAWYNENSGGRTHTVGTKSCNELGLYDMSGNVWELTSEKWGGDYSRPRTTSYYVMRGGAWHSLYSKSHLDCRVSRRSNIVNGGFEDIGLRLVL